MYAHDLWGDFASNCKVKADKSRCMFYVENESSFMLLKNNGMIALSLFIVELVYFTFVYLNRMFR